MKYLAENLVSGLCLIILCFSGTALADPAALVFERKVEPREQAFSLLVPRGWIVEGGAVRIMDERFGGALNMVECKFDLAVKSDSKGSAMIRWMPEMLCIDRAVAFGNPEGAIFNNALVRAKRDPVRFLLEVGIPYAHPRARNLRLIEQKALPNLAAAYQANTPALLRGPAGMSYHAAMITFSYDEDGTRYLEKMLTVIEDYGQMGGGLWKNRLSMLARAPENSYPAYEKVFAVIQNSGDWNPRWIEGEIRGQMQRNRTVSLTQQELQRLDNEIAQSRRQTQEAIQRDMHLTLTEQNDYKNPFTGKVERDTAQWKYRWVNESGNIIYTDNQNYDPNRDPELKIQGYKLTPGRP